MKDLIETVRKTEQLNEAILAKAFIKKSLVGFLKKSGVSVLGVLLETLAKWSAAAVNDKQFSEHKSTLKLVALALSKAEKTWKEKT